MSSSSSKPSTGDAVGVKTLRRGARRGRGRGALGDAGGERLRVLRLGHVDLRRLLAVGAGVGRLEIDDVAQQNLGFVEFVAPDDDRLEGQRALAKPGDHRLAAGLDPLGDGDFALARQQLDRAHLAQVHPHRIVRALGRLRRARGDSRRARGLDDLGARLGLFLVGRLGFLLGLFRLLELDDADAHLAQHRVDVLDLVGGIDVRRQYGVELVLGHPAALLGGLDEPLDRGVGEIQQRAVGGFHNSGFTFRFRLVVSRHSGCSVFGSIS